MALQKYFKSSSASEKWFHKICELYNIQNENIENQPTSKSSETNHRDSFR